MATYFKKKKDEDKELPTLKNKVGGNAPTSLNLPKVERPKVNTEKTSAPKAPTQKVSTPKVSTDTFDKSRVVPITSDNAKSVLSKDDYVKYKKSVASRGTKAEQYGNEHPIASTIASLAYAPAQGIASAVSTGAALATGDKKYINKYNQNADMRKGASANIKTGVGQTAYDIGTDIGDMLADTAVGSVMGGNLTSGLLMGGKQSQRAMQDAYNRTGDVRKSALYGTASGALEGVLNTKGLGIAKKETANGLNGILKAAGVEGAENLAQSVLDDVSDAIINGTDSRIASEYALYKNSGMSDYDALGNVALTALKKYGMDFGTGAGFGAVLGGVNNLVSRNIPTLDETYNTMNNAEILPDTPRVTNDVDNSYIDFVNGLNEPSSDVRMDVANAERIATIDNLRRENPQLLNGLSDEDVLNYFDAIQNENNAQNYSTMYNIMNNTDNNVPTLSRDFGYSDNGLDLMVDGSDLSSRVDEFRRNNPTLSENMTYSDVVDYMNTPKSDARLEVPAETPRMSVEDYDNSLNQIVSDYAIGDAVDDYVSADVVKNITFDNDADRQAFDDAYERFVMSINDIDNATSADDILDALYNADDAYRAMSQNANKGYYLDNSRSKEMKRIKKDFANRTRGYVINVPNELRAEYGLSEKTIAQLNRELSLGKGSMRFSANSGAPIDMLWDELNRASGNTLDPNGDIINNADQIARLLDYVGSVKDNTFDRMQINGNDIISDDLWSDISENVEAKIAKINDLGERPVAMPARVADNNTLTFKLRDEVPSNVTEVPTMPEVPTMNNVVEEVPTYVEMPNEVPSMEGNIRERGYATSIREKSDMPDEIKKEFVDNPEVYRQLSNANTKAEADYILNSNNTDRALYECHIRIERKDPVAIPLGYDLSKKLIDEGRREDATELLRAMSESLTQSGQFSQAAAINLMHNDPMTALRYMQKEIDKVNEQGRKQFKKKWTDFELTNEEIDMFGGYDMNDPYAKERIQNAFETVENRISKEYPVSFWTKLSEGRKLAMLLNPRTHIRNTVANGLLLPVRSATDRVSALGQNVAHLFNNDFYVNQSLVGGTREQKNIARQVFENDFKELLDGDNKWDKVTQNVRRNAQVFKGTPIDKGAVLITDKLTGGRMSQLIDEGKLSGSALEDLRNFDYWLLSTVEDDPFVKTNFVNRLASYMKAQGINDIDSIPPEAKSIAWEEALKATFKDDNNFTNMLSGLKKSLGKFGDIVFPFTKTPANLAVRAIDYSPIGIGKAIADYAKAPLDAKNVSKLWDDMSKGIVGSAGILLGMKLAESGVITGKLSDNKNKANFQKNQQGMQEMSINLGTDGAHHYSFDWAQPVGTPLVLGASIYDAIKNSDDENQSALETIKNGVVNGGKAAFDAWFNSSPLTTVQDLLSPDSYGSTAGSIADKFGDVFTSFPQSFIPAVVGATARAQDPTMRETYDATSGWNTWLNEGKAKIPSLTEDLPAKYDSWGNPRTRSDEGAMSYFAQYANPGAYSHSKETPIDNEIIRLGDAAGDKAYPHTAEWSVEVNSKNKKLNNAEHSNYQQKMGKTSYELAEHFINSDMYNGMSDDNRVETLNSLYGFSDALAKSELFGYDIEGNNTYGTMYKAYKSKGVDGVLDYMQEKIHKSDVTDQLESVGLSYTDNRANIIDTYGDKGLELLSAIDSYGKTSKGSVTASSMRNVLDNSGLSDYDAGYVLTSLIGNAKLTKTAKELASRNDYASVNEYYKIRDMFDANGNGKLDKRKELPYLEPWLRQNGYSQNDINAIKSWY